MPVTESRSVPSRLAGVLETLELDQPRVVTVTDLNNIATASALAMSGAELGYELHRLGWLLPLRTRGAWEFAPAARAGRYPAGDRYIELRATRATNPEFAGMLAMESAAVLHGLARYVPEREVLAIPRGNRVPKALRNWRVVSITLPGDPTTVMDGLPVWRIEALLAGMALRPDAYGAWRSVAQWLPRAVAQTDPAQLAALLDGASRAGWHRACYLLARGGRADIGIEFLTKAPSGRGPVYLGPRNQSGRFDVRFEVIDSVLAAGDDALQL